ncbi:serine/threonine-protein kinase 31-like isoform X2 [Lineus longissimus]|uniref:serine/threonine-protein kinase 31-like isoform X2 n=1 Tax=Lineus longissimus TaxID=88925 RepID=UPI00315DD2A7
MTSNVGPSIHGGTTTYDVFVGNLPGDIAMNNRERIEEYFRPYGKIHSVVVIESNRGAEEKISFVRFLDEKDAELACKELNGSEFDGRSLLVKRSSAKKKEDRPSNQSLGSDGQRRPQIFNRPPPKTQMMGEKPDLVKMGRPQQTNFRSQMGNPPQLVANQPQMSGNQPHMIGNQPYIGANPPHIVNQSYMGNRNHSSSPSEDDSSQTGNPPQISHWQSSVPSEPKEPEHEKDQGFEQMIISYVDGPNSFWGQEIKDNRAQELVKLSEDLLNICPLSPPVTGRPNFAKIYGALFSEDGQWYRCKPLSYVSETQTLVQYIDYGNNEVVENKQIVEVPNTLLAASPHAEKYVFHGLELAADDAESSDYKAAVNYLKEATDGKLVDAIVFGKEPISGATAVDLTIDGQSLTVPMINDGYLKKKSTGSVDHNNLKGPRNVQRSDFEEKPVQQSEQRPKGAYPQQNMGQSNSGWGAGPRCGDEWGAPEQMPQEPQPQQWGVQHQHSMQQQNQSSWGQPALQQMPMQNQMSGQMSNQMSNRPVISPQGNQMNRGGVGPGGDRKGGIRQDNLQLKLEKANREINKLQGEFTKAVAEKESALLELGTLKGRMKLVTEECAAVSKRACDLNISNKLKTLMSTVNKVKLMRIQFPTDNSSQDLIQNAIGLVSAVDVKITPDMELIRMVQDALSQYNECQMFIKQCTEQSDLEELISKRNVSRKVLYEKIEHFLEETKTLPVEARGNALRESINHLKLTYASFKIGSTSPQAPLNEVIHDYQEWRARKNSLYSDVRTNTNTAHNMVDSALKAIQELLSLDFILMPESKIMPPELDGLVNRLQTAVVREMEMSDLERSGDAPLVARTLTYLISDMMAELKNIDQLAAMKHAYSVMKASLVEWLDAKPDLAPLQAIRKSFKSLKSKLRHKLADKHDVEESDEDKEDLIRINVELAQIRFETHNAFLAEDEQMVKLSKFYEDHFPELSLQHPEIAIDKYVEYGGLVKAGLDVDQFDLQPLPGSEKSSVYQTLFNGENAILKEYIMDETIGVMKDDFLTNAVAYNAVKHKNLLKIEALFFHKNKRQAYLLLKQHTPLVTKLIEGAIDEVTAHKCLLGILNGLAALHQANIIHGAIKTENILLDNEGNGILAEFDFTKSVGQRACSLHMINTGLIFNAPETRVGIEVTKAADIFSFGVLFVMLHFPTKSFRTMPNGTPVLENTGWSQQTSIMLDNLLMQMPNSRISASNLLTLPYFTNPCQTRAEHTEIKDVLQLRGKSPSPTSEVARPSVIETVSETESQPTDAEDGTTAPSEALETPLPESDVGEDDLLENKPNDDKPELVDSSEEQSNESDVPPETEGLSQAIPDVVTQAADMPTVTSTDDDGDDGEDSKEVSEENTPEGVSEEVPDLSI